MAVKNNNVTGSIYLIAVTFIPTEAERIAGEKKKVVVPPQFLMADDDDSARNKAVLNIPRDLDPDRCEVLVSLPFGR
jgi:hypothetical protein